MNILKTFASAEKIANSDIRTIRKCFEYNGRGKRISLSAKQIKAAAKASVGIPSVAEEIQIRHLVCQIEMIEEQLSEIDKKIEEFSLQNNSPILSIPGISHFSGTSILAELGDICNYTKASQIIKFAGVAPYHYESSQFLAQHTAMFPIFEKNAVSDYLAGYQSQQGLHFLLQEKVSRRQRAQMCSGALY